MNLSAKASGSSSSTHRVVVIGGGFGGLFATQALRRVPVEVVLIDKAGHHLFQPLLYQVATGILSEGQVTRPLRAILAGQRNARIEVAEVTGVDLAAHEVEMSAFGSASRLHYDSLIVAAGAGYSYFGHDDLAAVAPGLKSIEDALAIRSAILTAFERAEQATNEADRRRYLTFAVIGGGPTGIEVSGQLRDLAVRSLKHNFEKIDPADAEVVLLEAAETLLPTYGARLSQRTIDDLRAVGVDVRLGAQVTQVDREQVVYLQAGQQHRLAATTKIWAAGVSAVPIAGTLAEQTGASRNRSGQLIVEPDCTLPGHPEVFVVGDLMSTPGIPGVAQLAIQSGRFAAHTIGRRLAGDDDRRPFTYRDKGSLATIAKYRAVATVRGYGFAGFPAWAFWLAVHLWTVMGFGRRLSVLLRWTFAFVADRRPERVMQPLTHQSVQPEGRADPRAQVVVVTSATRPE
jgi:NADH dehydrogenase